MSIELIRKFLGEHAAQEARLHGSQLIEFGGSPEDVPEDRWCRAVEISSLQKEPYLVAVFPSAKCNGFFAKSIPRVLNTLQSRGKIGDVRKCSSESGGYCAYIVTLEPNLRIYRFRDREMEAKTQEFAS